MDTESEAVTKLNEQLQTEVNQLTARHKKLLSHMTLQEAQAKLKETSAEVGALREGTASICVSLKMIIPTYLTKRYREIKYIAVAI